jgi:hypothetical protein
VVQENQIQIKMIKMIKIKIPIKKKEENKDTDKKIKKILMIKNLKVF